MAKKRKQTPGLHPVGLERRPSPSTYIVCYDLLPREEDDGSPALETLIEQTLSDLHGIHVFGNVWFVAVRKTNSRKLNKYLKECLNKGDSLLVSKIQPFRTHGKNIKMALDLLDEMGQGA